MIQRLFAAWAALRGQPMYAALPDAKLLEIGPDDRVLLECEKHLTNEQVRQLTEYMIAWLAGGNTRAAVLTGGIRLVAVRKRPNAEANLTKGAADEA